MKRTVRLHVYTNALYRKITFLYALLLLIMAFFVCYMAYSKEHNTIVNQLDQSMANLNYEYHSITDDFWRLYMPFSTNEDQVYAIMNHYFTGETGGKLSPLERRDMVSALQIIMAGDDRMKWIGVFRGAGQPAYLLLQNTGSLIEMTEDFPFFSHLVNKRAGMQIFESLPVVFGGNTRRYFALCGGSGVNLGSGKIIMGYESQALAVEHRQLDIPVDADFYICNDFGLIYDSSGEHDMCLLEQLPSGDGISRSPEGKPVYVRELENDSRNYKIFCVVPWWDMLVQCNVFTPYILCMVVVFWAFSLLLYRGAGHVIQRRIEAIQIGLGKISDNELDYRIPVPKTPSDEFEIISQSINSVTERLQDNINRAYLSKLRQKEAELSELQAKFDPHFLYNTLEVIRGKVSENGDDETAGIIVKLAAIFRSFIGSENFVSIREEIEFCNLYLSLLKYRYDNAVKILYDIDSEILNYGIIRNLLQPLLENYFVHGFNNRKPDNQLSIRGKLWDEDLICFIIRDNGLGVSDERLDMLKNNLDAVETGTRHGYGLKSVNRRAKLFYGPECGLSVDRNDDGGITIRVLIRRMTCEEHKAKLSIEE